MSAAKRQRSVPVALEDLLVHARIMWRNDPSNPRATGSEDRDFREFFGCNVLNALLIWNMLVNTGFLPALGSHHHYLWALCYLKQYPKTKAMCTLCGGVDPTTVRKWVWAFISALSALEDFVVSTGETMIMSGVCSNNNKFVHSSSYGSLIICFACSVVVLVTDCLGKPIGQ